MKNNLLSGSELGFLLEGKAKHGEKLVVLTSSQWDAITDAYDSNLISRINKDIWTVHPVKDVVTKRTSFILTIGNGE